MSLRARVAMFGVLGACGCAGGSPCGPGEAVVERVIDGDTIVVTGEQKIRYLLVDAPEHTDGHDDCFGASAARVSPSPSTTQSADARFPQRIRSIGRGRTCR